MANVEGSYFKAMCTTINEHHITYSMLECELNIGYVSLQISSQNRLLIVTMP